MEHSYHNRSASPTNQTFRADYLELLRGFNEPEVQSSLTEEELEILEGVNES